MTSKSCLEIYSNKLYWYCGKAGHRGGDYRLRKKNKEEKGESAKLARSGSLSAESDDELAFVCRELTENGNHEAKRRSEKKSKGEVETALVCVDGRRYPAFNGDTMIADSGCSCHMVKNGDFLEEPQDITESISGIGEGQMLAVKKGKMRCAFKGANGSTVYWTMFPVKVVQGLQEDQFSVTAELINGEILSSDERKNIVLEYEDG